MKQKSTKNIILIIAFVLIVTIAILSIPIPIKYNLATDKIVIHNFISRDINFADNGGLNLAKEIYNKDEINELIKLFNNVKTSNIKKLWSKLKQENKGMKVLMYEIEFNENVSVAICEDKTAIIKEGGKTSNITISDEAFEYIEKLFLY